MENNFIARIMKVTLVLASATCFITGLYAGTSQGIGVLLGAFWGMANLYFMKISIEKWLVPGNRDHWVLFALLQLKFPLLYLGGYGLLKAFPPLYLILGSSLVFLAIFFLGIYKMMTQTKGLV